MNCPKNLGTIIAQERQKFTSGWCAPLKNAFIKLPNFFEGSGVANYTQPTVHPSCITLPVVFSAFMIYWASSVLFLPFCYFLTTGFHPCVTVMCNNFSYNLAKQEGGNIKVK